MVRSKKITLLKMAISYGSNPSLKELNKKEVLAKIEKAYAKTFFEAKSAGVMIEKTALVFKNSFESDTFTHCLLDNELFKIETALGSSNSQSITLLLSKG